MSSIVTNKLELEASWSSDHASICCCDLYVWADCVPRFSKSAIKKIIALLIYGTFNCITNKYMIIVEITRSNGMIMSQYHVHLLGNAMQVGAWKYSDINWTRPWIVPTSWDTLKLIVPVGSIQGNTVVATTVHVQHVCKIFSHTPNGEWEGGSGACKPACFPFRDKASEQLCYVYIGQLIRLSPHLSSFVELNVYYICCLC